SLTAAASTGEIAGPERASAQSRVLLCVLRRGRGCGPPHLRSIPRDERSPRGRRAPSRAVTAMDRRHRLQVIRPSTAGKSATLANLLEARRKLRKYGRRRALCSSAPAPADAG